MPDFYIVVQDYLGTYVRGDVIPAERIKEYARYWLRDGAIKPYTPEPEPEPGGAKEGEGVKGKKAKPAPPVEGTVEKEGKVEETPDEPDC